MTSMKRDTSMTKLADVARLAGVSVTSVSHVVNGSRAVSDELRERVQYALETTGYRPNAVARALRRSTTESMGFVASDIGNSFSTAVIRGAEFSCRKAGRTLLVANSHEDPVLESAAVDTLCRWPVDGLILAPTPGITAQTLANLRALNTPVVMIDQKVDANFDHVLVANVEPVEDMVGRLIALGHRRIGIVAGPVGASTTIERIQGWRQAHQDTGLAIDPSLVISGVVQSDAAEDSVKQMLSLQSPPTAVFAASGAISLGVVRGLRRLGLEIPNDISVAGFDDFEWADAFEPRLSVIAQPTAEIGQEAVRLLLLRIANRERRRAVQRLEPTLILRDSLAPPKPLGRGKLRSAQRK